jgi:NADH-quinone oxidoreductase subunit G
MPHVVIDGKTFEAEPNKTIIEVAFENGLDIPHFCWHPELSVSGNCRMCLVEVGMPKRMPDGSFEKDADGKNIIGFIPKLQIACATGITDGMHVKTKSDGVVTAQEAVMEFILINHPLDCPICDEAGQCKLQEYAFIHTNGESRFDDVKNHKDKRVSWGPNVLFDAERCITCSRCIRFANEVAKQPVLTFVQRGDKVTIKTFEGTELDSPYSMNVIDICPVGALTSKDFRFKSRVWDMSFNDSICPGCSRGCNIKIGVRNNEILRLEPKANPFVNKFWMCDYGRLTQYQNTNGNRISEPKILLDGNQKLSTWQEALSDANQKLSAISSKKIMVLGSPFATNEDNYILSIFAKKVLKTENIDFYKFEDNLFSDDKLKTNDRTPNSAGALAVGISTGSHHVTVNNLVEKIKTGEITALYSIDNSLERFPELISVLDELELFILHSENESAASQKANIVFPSSTFAEIEGTFTNFENRVQHFMPAVITAENLRFMGMKMSRLDKFGADNDRWTKHDLRHSRQHWRILQQLANMMNAGWSYTSTEDIFDAIVEHIDQFKGMSYELLDEYQGLKFMKASSPEAKKRIYQSHYLKPN